MSSENKESSLIEQFSQAIQSVKDRITGYNQKVKQFKEGVNTDADKLRQLVERLRKCLEGLRGLKQNHESFVTKLQSIYQNIDTERERAIEDSSTDEAKKCNDKIQTIYGQFKELESTLGEMETDFSNTMGEQLTALGGVIDELCKEGDGLSNQISSSSAAVGQEIEKLSQKVSSKPLDEVKQDVVDTSPEGGRTVFINSIASDIWKSAGEPPNVYYFRADGAQFNDGTSMVESSYTHPKDYPSAMKGGWRTTGQLKSLSRTHPIRSLKITLVKKNKKNKKNKKKTKKRKLKRKKSKKHKRKKSKRKTKKRK